MTSQFASICSILFGCHLCLLIVPSTSNERMRRGRFFPESRSAYDWDPEENVVISESKAKAFLQEYGYMKTFDRKLKKWVFKEWKYEDPYLLSKEIEQTSDSESFIAIEAFGSETQTSVDPESSESPEEQKLFYDALKEFQKKNNLPVSGQVDEQTMKLFLRPRCGVPDNRAMFFAKNSKKESVSPNQNKPHTQRYPNLHQLLRTTAPNVAQDYKSIVSTTPSFSDELTTVITAYTDVTDEIVTTQTPEPTRRKKRANLFNEIIRRTKRSQITNGDDNSGSQNSDSRFTKSRLKWRIYDNYRSQYLDHQDARNTLKKAFRMWAEVSPLTFVEDTTGDVAALDITFAFATGAHLSDGYPFNEYEVVPSQLSHAFTLSSVHFNDQVHYTIDSNQGYSLLKTAVHEIGHVLGLPHNTTNSQSVMYPYYTGYDRNNFDLHDVDRNAIQNKYGKCNGSFDSIFDWVFVRANGRRVYSSYFFNKSVNWMYDNRKNRTRKGEPVQISGRWEGIPNNIDAIVQILSSNKLYFFAGSRVIEFDTPQKMAVGIDPATGLAPGDPISSKFPGIPNNLDTAYFDKKDKKIFFFKGSLVYVFDPDINSVESGYPKPISEVFTGRHTTNNGTSPPLESNLDAAYYSYKHGALFFFKGTKYWRNYYSRNSETQEYIRRVGFAQHWNGFWNEICEVE